jgi:hypothetical protein
MNNSTTSPKLVNKTRSIKTTSTQFTKQNLGKNQTHFHSKSLRVQKKLHSSCIKKQSPFDLSHGKSSKSLKNSGILKKNENP